MVSRTRARLDAAAAIFEHYWLPVVWCVGGPVSFMIAVSSYFGFGPELDHRIVLPGLFCFGAVTVASLISLGQSALATWSVGDPDAPQDSLHPGQFCFALMASLALGCLVACLLLIAYLGAISFADGLSPVAYPGWKGSIPWLAAVVCGVWGVMSLVWVPAAGMFGWFSARRALQRLQTDALLSLARATREGARTTSPPA